MRAQDANGIRHCILQHFPYTVCYEAVDHKVTVLAVAHQRREPGYWRERKLVGDA